MGGLDFAEVSFFELDRLFSLSARALRKKQARRRQDGGDSSPSRSRSRNCNLRRGRLQPNFGGFTGPVLKVERTIVVSGVPNTADEPILYEHFGKCGPVRDVRLQRNRRDLVTGIAVIEFHEDDAVLKAITLTGPQKELMGATIQMKRADAQLAKNQPAAPKRPMTRSQVTQHVLSGMAAGEGSGSGSGSQMRKLHVKNLPKDVKEADLRVIFREFGEFQDISLGTGECWITYQNAADAQMAMTMNGYVLVGKQELIISLQPVAPITTVVVTPTVPKPLVVTPSLAESWDLKNDSDFGATGAGDATTNRLEMMKKLQSSRNPAGVPTVIAGGGSVFTKPGPAPAPGESLAPQQAPPRGQARQRDVQDADAAELVHAVGSGPHEDAKVL